MIYNIIAYTLIRSAFEKGLNRIIENPEREIRNLVDLGKDFSKGKNQQNFFTMAVEELERDDSIYYKLAERVIRSTDPQVMLDFGMNLGYNGWTHGTKLIRHTIEENGFIVPWILLIELGSQTILDPDLITDLVHQGKKIGIYSYAFFVDKDYPGFDDLFTVFEREKECAFFLFMHPAHVNETVAVRLLETRTIFACIDLDVEDLAVRDAAASLLNEYKCLRSGFSRIRDFDAPDLLDTVDKLNLPFVVFAEQEKSSMKIKMPGFAPSKMVDLRKNLNRPVLPMELFGDIVMVNRYISNSGRVVMVRADGTVKVADADQDGTGPEFSIHRSTLEEILQLAASVDMSGNADANYSGFAPLSSST